MNVLFLAGVWVFWVCFSPLLSAPFHSIKDCVSLRQHIIQDMLVIGVSDSEANQPQILVMTTKWAIINATFDYNDDMALAVRGQVMDHAWSHLSYQSHDLARMQRWVVAAFYDQCSQIMEVTFKMQIKEPLFRTYKYRFENSTLVLLDSRASETKVLQRKIAADCHNRTLVYDENGLSLLATEHDDDDEGGLVGGGRLVRFNVCVRTSPYGPSEGVEISTRRQPCEDSMESSLIFASTRSGFVLESRGIVFLFTSGYVLEFPVNVLFQHERYFPLRTKPLYLWIDCGEFHWGQGGLRDGDRFVSFMSMALFVFFILYGAITIYYMFAETNRSAKLRPSKASRYKPRK